MLRNVEGVPQGERETGFFFHAVRALDGRPQFASLIDSADTSQLETHAGFDRFIGELCRAAAALYLAHPHARIAYVHTLTAPSALRLIAPHLSQSTRERAAGRALQAAAALHAVSLDPAQPALH